MTDDLDGWDGDEWDDDPLEADPADPDAHQHRRRLRPTGGTPTASAPTARQAVIDLATGRRQPDDDWRQQLSAGQRARAAAALAGRGFTHRADSGFGLAGRPR